MAKRSPGTFERHHADKYRTPALAVIRLAGADYLPETVWPQPGDTWVEPCAGDGCMIRHWRGARLHLVAATDLHPDSPWIGRADALTAPLPPVDWIITNPPWRRDLLHPMINRFRRHAALGTWLLFDADWHHTAQARPYLPFCHAIVSVGRLKWFPGSQHVGKDNAAWYLFKQHASPHYGPIFYSGV